jgi:excisionase family DNA binding protein
MAILQLHGGQFPGNRQKSLKNAEFCLDLACFAVDICSVHSSSLEASLQAGFFSQMMSCAGGHSRTGSLWKGMNMADSREVMNIRQASQYLGVSPDTLYKYVNDQKIPAFKLGNRWRFKKSRLDQWMEEKSSEMEVKKAKKPKAAGQAAGQP